MGVKWQAEQQEDDALSPTQLGILGVTGVLLIVGLIVGAMVSTGNVEEPEDPPKVAKKLEEKPKPAPKPKPVPKPKKEAIAPSKPQAIKVIPKAVTTPDSIREAKPPKVKPVFGLPPGSTKAKLWPLAGYIAQCIGERDGVTSGWSDVRIARWAKGRAEKYLGKAQLCRWVSYRIVNDSKFEGEADTMARRIAWNHIIYARKEIGLNDPIDFELVNEAITLAETEIFPPKSTEQKLAFVRKYLYGDPKSKADIGSLGERLIEFDRARFNIPLERTRSLRGSKGIQAIVILHGAAVIRAQDLSKTDEEKTLCEFFDQAWMRREISEDGSRGWEDRSRSLALECIDLIRKR